MVITNLRVENNLSYVELEFKPLRTDVPRTHTPKYRKTL